MTLGPKRNDNDNTACIAYNYRHRTMQSF